MLTNTLQTVLYLVSDCAFIANDDEVRVCDVYHKEQMVMCMYVLSSRLYSGVFKYLWC